MSSKRFERGEVVVCACGCGGTTNRWGKDGYEKKYINGHQCRGRKMSKEAIRKMAARKKGTKQSAITIKRRVDKIKGQRRGGRTANNGYIYIKAYDHPYKDKQNYVLEHRLVMEAHLGRYLLPTEVVHHINNIPWDNRIENLMLFATTGDHSSFHRIQEWKMKKGRAR